MSNTIDGPRDEGALPGLVEGRFGIGRLRVRENTSEWGDLIVQSEVACLAATFEPVRRLLLVLHKVLEQ